MVIWYDEGVIYRAILEFIWWDHITFNLSFILLTVAARLTQKHDGLYLAKVTAECLERFGLGDLVCTRGHLIYFVTLKIPQLHSVCMDNASNCDGTAKHLPDFLPVF